MTQSYQDLILDPNEIGTLRLDGSSILLNKPRNPFDPRLDEGAQRFRIHNREKRTEEEIGSIDKLRREPGKHKFLDWYAGKGPATPTGIYAKKTNAPQTSTTFVPADEFFEEIYGEDED